MRKIIRNSLAILIFSILHFGCSNSPKPNENNLEVKKPINDTITNKISTNNDSIELTELTRSLYKWVETKNSNNDFNPLGKSVKDSFYTELDMNEHNIRLKELRETNLFTEEFLDNYHKIALTINKELKYKKNIWHVDYMSPFSDGANQWCECQDNPDNYWEYITIKNLKIIDNRATFIWTWGDKWKHEYKIIASKINNKWKISYLHGFDYKYAIVNKDE